MPTRQVSINVPTFLQYAPCPYEVLVEPHPLFLKLELMWRVFKHQFERNVFALRKVSSSSVMVLATAVRCSSCLRNIYVNFVHLLSIITRLLLIRPCPSSIQILLMCLFYAPTSRPKVAPRASASGLGFPGRKEGITFSLQMILFVVSLFQNKKLVFL